METTIIHRGYLGIMEKKMETTVYGSGFTYAGAQVDHLGNR